MKLVFWVWFFDGFAKGVLTAMLLFVVFSSACCGGGLYPGAHTITRPEAPAFDCAVRAWEDTVGPLDTTCRARLYSAEILLTDDTRQIQELCMARPNTIYGCTTIHDKGMFLLWSLGTRPMIVASATNPKWTASILPGLLVHESAHILAGCTDPRRGMDSPHAREELWGPGGVVEKGTRCTDDR